LEIVMRVIDVLHAKQASLIAIFAHCPLAEAIALMAAHQVGSVVATDLANNPIGIITEPDIVSAVAAGGAASLNQRLCTAMRAPAPTCDPDDSVAHALAPMTRSRVRYLLAARDGRTFGLVSIGDLVKARLESAELESRVLRDMARGAVLARS
jgi:CBS domain-containing protein